MTPELRAAIEDACARLARYRADRPAWVRAVRLGVSKVGGPCDITLDSETTAEVRASTRVPGALDLTLVRKVKGRAATSFPLLASTSAERESASPRRSVRVSDELWNEAATYGDPSTVTRDALEAWLVARRKG